MPNDYYTATGTPGTGAAGASAPIRNEYSLIEAGFAKLPALSGLAVGTAIIVNPSGTGLTNTVGKLALAGDFTVSGSSALTLTITGATSVTLPTTGTLATLDGIEAFTNKTLAAPTITGTVAGGATYAAPTITGPTITGTVAGGATYSSITLTTPVLGTPSSGTLTNCTGLLGTGVVAAGTTWTPTDGSGVGLTFTGVNAKYQQIGNMIFAYFRLIYPPTADGTGARISGLPVAVVNQSYANGPVAWYANGGTGGGQLVPVIGTSTAAFVTVTGAGITNAQMSTLTVSAMLIYPAS